MSMDDLGLEAGRRDVIVLPDGTVLETHGPKRCEGTHCSIHNPSDHPLNEAPLTWIRSINLMMRICEHGMPHPDPDSVAVLGFNPLGWHPCCAKRCCR